jgi:hypothetical protein
LSCLFPPYRGNVWFMLPSSKKILCFERFKQYVITCPIDMIFTIDIFFLIKSVANISVKCLSIKSDVKCEILELSKL